jgi:transcriptional regulator with XRE-family HTH domain
MESNEIKKYRELAGMTVEELALKVDVTPQAVRDWEAGRRNPRKLYLRIVRQALNRRLPEPIPE